MRTTAAGQLPGCTKEPHWAGENANEFVHGSWFSWAVERSGDPCHDPNLMTSYPKNFSLKWLLIGVTVISCLFGALAAGGLQGLVIYLCILMGIYTLLAPAPASMSARGAVIFVGIGAALLSWCVLQGMFGSLSIGQGWYRGNLAEIGGWGTGLLASAWRASHLLNDRGE